MFKCIPAFYDSIFVHRYSVCIVYIFLISSPAFLFPVDRKLCRTGEGQAGNRLAASYTTMSKYLKVFTVPTDTQ